MDLERERERVTRVLGGDATFLVREDGRGEGVLRCGVAERLVTRRVDVRFGTSLTLTVRPLRVYTIIHIQCKDTKCMDLSIFFI